MQYEMVYEVQLLVFKLKFNPNQCVYCSCYVLVN